MTYIVFHISTEALSFTFMNIYQYLIFYIKAAENYTQNHWKKFWKTIEGHKMEIVLTFIGNRIYFGYP